MNKDSPLVSVVMTVYSNEHYLRESIDSILAQSYTNFEFIIVKEFGSDENTCQILAEYAAKDNRIKIIENLTKLGFAASLNRGIDEAKGKYIARMDGDDISLPQRFKYQVAFMEKHPDVLVCGGRIKFLFMGENHFANFLRNRVINYPRETKEIRNYILFSCPFAHPSVMFNREILNKNRLRYNENIQTEDYELWSRIVFGYQVANMPKQLIRYRQHGGNATATASSKVSESTNRIRACIIKRFIPEYPHIHFNFEKSTGDSLSEIENVLHSLYKEHTETFSDKKILRKFMNSKYQYYYYECQKQKCYAENHPIERYWSVFGDIYDPKRNRPPFFDKVFYSLYTVAYRIYHRVKGMCV